jgi:hypothetical protein
MRALSVGAILLLALAPRAEAQYEDFGLWLGGSVTGKLPAALNDANGSWRVWLDLQLRFGDDASRFSQGIIRPAIGYALSPVWTVWLGYAYINTEPPYVAVTTYEQRIWEQASWSDRIGLFRLSSRTRLEQRFVSTGSIVGWRAREMLKGSVPLASIFSAVLYDEFFYNFNTTNFGTTAGPDRNRFFVGPGVTISPQVTVEVGYLHQYVFRNNSPDKTDNILAVNTAWTF